MNKSFVISSALLLSLAAAGCSKENSAKKQQPGTAPAAAQAGKVGAGPTAAVHPAGLGTGKVLETMNSAGYTYVKVDVAGKEIWAAGPELEVAVGETVSLPEGSPMPGYHSKTLDRTFEMIYFVSAIAKGGAGAAVANPHGQGGSVGKPPAPEIKVEGIARADGGKTVAEIFSGKAGLGGKPVVVRGKVVKENRGIMGKNWLHIQDGSGAAGTNDLTVTTQDQVALGDTVLIRGTVALDKDFGAGYKYDVLLEDASVTKE